MTSNVISYAFYLNFQFPVGRRTACDIYWHGVSFHDNENIVSGQVNKFPGKLFTLLMVTYYNIVSHHNIIKS